MLPELAGANAELEEVVLEIERLVRSVDSATLNAQPAAGFNSIYATVVHIAGSMTWWLGEIVARREVHRDREAEFRARGDDAEELVRVLDEARALSQEVLATLTPAMLDETRQARTLTLPVRQIIPHVLAHTALHWGHIQITTQLLQSRVLDAGRRI